MVQRDEGAVAERLALARADERLPAARSVISGIPSC